MHPYNMCANTLGGAWKLKPARPARSRNLTQPAQPLAARYKQKRNERDKPTFSLSRSLSNTLYRTLQEWSALEKKKKKKEKMTCEEIGEPEPSCRTLKINRHGERNKSQRFQCIVKREDIKLKRPRSILKRC